MASAIWHDPAANIRFLVPGVGQLSVYDLPEVHQEAPQEYALWMQWRYQHISVEFVIDRNRLAEFMWKSKKPWWIQF